MPRARVVGWLRTAFLVLVLLVIASCAEDGAEQAVVESRPPGTLPPGTWPEGAVVVTDVDDGLADAMQRFFRAWQSGDGATAWDLLDETCKVEHGTPEAFQEHIELTQGGIAVFVRMSGREIAFEELELDLDASVRWDVTASQVDASVAVVYPDGSAFADPNPTATVEWNLTDGGWRTAGCLFDDRDNPYASGGPVPTERPGTATSGLDFGS